MASYRHSDATSLGSEVGQGGYGEHLGIVLNLAPPESHGHGPVTAMHANWNASTEVSVVDSGRRLLMLHWGLPRRFSMRRNQQFIGCFDAQPGDWTLVEPGTLETVQCNGAGPLLLVWFDDAKADGDAGDSEVPAKPQIGVHNTIGAVGEPAQTRRGMQGGHHSEIERMGLGLVRELHRGHVINATRRCQELLEKIDGLEGQVITPGRDPRAPQRVDTGATVVPFGPGQPNQRGGLAPFNLRRVMEFVEGNLTEPLSVDQLAQQASLSPFHFARSFKHSTGMTPHQYVTERRMRHAKRMLSDFQMKLAEVGKQAGFSSQSRFTTVFRKHVGLTPGEYRRLIQSRMLV